MLLLLAACSPSPAPGPATGGPPGGTATTLTGSPPPTDTTVDTAATDTGTGTTTTEPPSLLSLAEVDAVLGACTVLAELAGGGGEHLGSAVFAVGDLDGYGTSALAVLGGRTLTVRDPDGTVRASVGDVTFAASAGDTDGDGIVDLFVRRSAGGGGPATGNVERSQVLDGRTLDVLSTGDVGLEAMAALGDVTGDGRTELGWLDYDTLRVVDGVTGALIAQSSFAGGALAAFGDGSAAVGAETQAARVGLDGRLAWTAATRGPSRLAVTAGGDVLIGDAAADRVFAVDGADGTELWTDTLAGVSNGTAIAASGADALVGGHGIVRLLSGGVATVELRERGAAPARFGRAVDAVPDQDGDGRPELAIGLPDAGLGQGGVAVLSCAGG